jgi:methyl coenzyme M reductase gamma subunit
VTAISFIKWLATNTVRPSAARSFIRGRTVLVRSRRLDHDGVFLTVSSGRSEEK